MSEKKGFDIYDRAFKFAVRTAKTIYHSSFVINLTFVISHLTLTIDH